jgi:enoyl-CoA hydratase/carnithine racemase
VTDSIETWPGVRVTHMDGDVACMTLDRPQALNAFDDEMLVNSLPAALASIAARDTRVMVLTGAGRAFCAGADLGLRGFELEDPTHAAAYVRAAHRVPVAIRQLTIPVIGAINGPAVGAGVGLALACDIRLASPEAFFQLPFVEIGIVPDFGVSFFLPRTIGESRAMELVLTGRRVGADEAARIGLVSSVVPDAGGAALAMAQAIARHSPYAVQTARSNIYRGQVLSLDDAVLGLEANTQSLALSSEEFRRRFSSYRRSIVDAGGPPR